MAARFKIEKAVPTERLTLEELARRASLANEGDREALRNHPDAICLPPGQIEAGQVFLARHEGRIAGFAVLLPRPDEDQELDGLFVEPDLWRCGIGRGLVAHCVGMAHAQGARYLHVVGNPHAESFYLATGFQPYGIAQTRFGLAIQMKRRLIP